MQPPDTVFQRQIVAILHDIFHIPESKLQPDQWDEPLTGKALAVSAIDMTYLLFEIEKTFGIRIEASRLDNYGAISIRRLGKILTESIGPAVP